MILRWMSVLPVGFLTSGLVYVVTDSILVALKAPHWVTGILNYVFPPIVGLFTSAAVAPRYKFITAVTITSVYGAVNILAIGWLVWAVFLQKSHGLPDGTKLAIHAVQTLIYIAVLIACCLEIGRREMENLQKQSSPPPISAS